MKVLLDTYLQTFCDTIAEIDKEQKLNGQMDQRTHGLTDVMSEIVFKT